MNINISYLKKHFFCEKSYECNNIDKKDKIRTKIVNYCFYSINEAKISNKIKKIPYYSNYYSIVTSYDFINISTIKDQIMEKVTLLDENKKYLLFTYLPFSINFGDFLMKFKEPKLLIFNMITTFSYLLQSLIQLQDQNICFFQLSPENIVFTKELRENPLLINFQLSLQVSKLNIEYITNIIKKTKDYGFKPLEVHVLFYIIENNLETISYSFIEEIIETFMQNLSLLSFFSQSYRENYKNACIESLKKYINIPKTEIILDILNYNDTWDIYGISVLYLHIFASISKIFSLKQTFISKITLELSKNIHPNPSKRSSLIELLDAHNKLLNLQTDWSFINHLDSRRMSDLWEILEQ
jgi:hypothetical protein